jgi:phthalate 4,5-dioxygenase oxygenase subunit
MLTREENELLTQVTGDAPAGQMMRRYWLPACWSEEVVEPDGTPMRVRMFGENFVAFRDTSGNVGLVDASCPHRLASLALGRNEEGGLRCIYHGWKFDVAGHCVEMPTEPAGYNFAEKMRIRSYPVRDAGGLLWVYLGPPELEPPFPAYDWTALPRNRIALIKYAERANYVQCVEGVIDTAHTWFLHRGITRDWEKRTAISADLAPRLELEDTSYGFRYAAIRSTRERPGEQKYVKITLFAFPTTGFISRPMDPNLAAHVQIFVPIDDEHTMIYSVMHSLNGLPVDEAAIRYDMRMRPGIDLDAKWRPGFCSEDGWTQDREAMKRGDFTGIAGFPNQDVAVQESMGRTVDRSREHLGTSDVAIIRMRRRMLESVRRFTEGRAPIGLDAPVDYAGLRAEQAVIPIDRPWQSVGPIATHGARDAAPTLPA